MVGDFSLGGAGEKSGSEIAGRVGKSCEVGDQGDAGQHRYRRLADRLRTAHDASAFLGVSRILSGLSSTGLGLRMPCDVVSGYMGCQVGQGE